MASCAMASLGAEAAGHFDVDDAGTLDPGQCQYETWWGRTGVEPVTGFHIGPSCRVGPVELGLNVDRLSVQDVQRVHSITAGPQLKWTFLGQAADAPLSAAVSMGTVSDLRRGGRMGGQFVVPVTWRPVDSLQLHANLGADWALGSGVRTPRGGLAAEWALTDVVSLIAERNRASGAWTSRVGGRFSLTPLISVDISASRSRPLGGRSVTGFVVGLNHEFSWK
ncbi:hypothetical protein J2W30_001321 [Variovorax boronicumulans]|uniref:hypothetical protein n=1 Tax=Variovorax TaxID=34072 RepID=UPI002788EDCB|nr:MULTISPECIES: hypothetical protein [Variovorax]MDP9990288.1 hypothetical protein [Variovorax boronicumulans]MDQ0001203.1 hypothetical protein [Variovorax boronicumulans]MDQ0033574.1 hypothetical protein [Variovorax boronicumulans]MDQ0606423.1 hypothetical protein [Variovorax sp. W1I1]